MHSVYDSSSITDHAWWSPPLLLQDAEEDESMQVRDREPQERLRQKVNIA